MKLSYPENTFLNEYKFTESGVWTPYNEDGIMLIKSEYKEEVLANIQSNGILKIEDESGNTVDFNGEWYVINTSVDTLIESLFMRWETSQIGAPLLVANPTEWTNGNVTVTITYPVVAVTKEYSLDTITWIPYTSAITINTNNTTVYARGTDASGNESGVATLTVTNIDKITPTVTYGTNGGTKAGSISTVVTVSDAGGSGVNTSTLEYMWDTQNITTPASGWTSFSNGSQLTMADVGTYYLWIKAYDNAGNSVVDKSNTFIVEPEFGVGIIATKNSTINGEDPTYDNPIVPVGFKAVNDGAIWPTGWNDGLVIEDTKGNQFVWVPVDGVTLTYAKWNTPGSAYYLDTHDDTVPAGFSISSITTKYKGFYIARYEAMFDYNGGSIRAASKKSTNKTTTDWSSTRNSAFNGYLWNYINYTSSKNYAQNMASSYAYDLSKIGTNLITGTQWDTVMKWIRNSGVSVTDSRTWGNHSNSLSPANVSGFGNLQISGYSELWKAKNIYDLAGNAWEWAGDVTSSYSMRRGGYYYASGFDTPAAYRASTMTSVANQYISFRIALFIL